MYGGIMSSLSFIVETGVGHHTSHDGKTVKIVQMCFQHKVTGSMLEKPAPSGKGLASFPSS